MNLLKMFFLIAILIISCGCTSVSNVDTQNFREVLTSNIQIGETVEVETTEGQTYTFVVTAIDENNIASENILLPLGKIVSIKKEEFSLIKTTGAVVGGVSIFLYIMAALATAAIF